MKKEVIVEYEDLGFAHVIGKTVQELIRCRDCKHNVMNPYRDCDYGLCNAHEQVLLTVKEDDWCSKAVRREEDDFN